MQYIEMYNITSPRGYNYENDYAYQGKLVTAPDSNKVIMRGFDPRLGILNDTNMQTNVEHGYGKMADELLLDKFEETNLEPNEDVYYNYSRMQITNRESDKNLFEDEAPRRNTWGVDRLNLTYNGHRGEADEPAHPEMIDGFIGDTARDPRGSAEGPDFKEISRQSWARNRFIPFGTDTANEYQVNGGQISEPGMIKVRRDVFDSSRGALKWFSTQKDGLVVSQRVPNKVKSLVGKQVTGQVYIGADGRNNIRARYRGEPRIDGTLPSDFIARRNTDYIADGEIYDPQHTLEGDLNMINVEKHPNSMTNWEQSEALLQFQHGGAVGMAPDNAIFYREQMQDQALAVHKYASNRGASVATAGGAEKRATLDQQDRADSTALKSRQIGALMATMVRGKEARTDADFAAQTGIKNRGAGRILGEYAKARTKTRQDGDFIEQLASRGVGRGRADGDIRVAQKSTVGDAEKSAHENLVGELQYKSVKGSKDFNAVRKKAEDDREHADADAVAGVSRARKIAFKTGSGYKALAVVDGESQQTVKYRTGKHARETKIANYDLDKIETDSDRTQKGQTAKQHQPAGMGGAEIAKSLHTYATQNIVDNMEAGVGVGPMGNKSRIKRHVSRELGGAMDTMRAE